MPLENWPYTRWYIPRWLSSTARLKLTREQRGLMLELFWIAYESDGTIPGDKEELRLRLAAADGPPAMKDVEACLQFWAPTSTAQAGLKPGFRHPTVDAEIECRQLERKKLQDAGKAGGQVSAGCRHKARLKRRSSIGQATRGEERRGKEREERPSSRGRSSHSRAGSGPARLDGAHPTGAPKPVQKTRPDGIPIDPDQDCRNPHFAPSATAVWGGSYWTEPTLPPDMPPECRR